MRNAKRQTYLSPVLAVFPSRPKQQRHTRTHTRTHTGTQANCLHSLMFALTIFYPYFVRVFRIDVPGRACAHVFEFVLVLLRHRRLCSSPCTIDSVRTTMRPGGPRLSVCVIHMNTLEHTQTHTNTTRRYASFRGVWGVLT